MTDWRQLSIQRVITASYGGQALLIPFFPCYCDSCLLRREAFRSRFPASLPISIIQTKHHREKCIKAIKYHKGLLQTPGGTNKITALMKSVLWLSSRPFVNIPAINNARAPACLLLPPPEASGSAVCAGRGEPEPAACRANALQEAVGAAGQQLRPRPLPHHQGRKWEPATQGPGPGLHRQPLRWTGVFMSVRI